LINKKKEHVTEEVLWEYLHDLAHGLSYLHSKGMIHRDIKCQNILIGENGELKIGDLGLLAYDKNGENVEYAGTEAYFAPEIIKEKKYNAKVDVWALGCVMYYLATLTHPFYNSNYLELTKNIVQRDVAELTGYSNEFSSLVRKMLNKSPNERPSSKTILEYTHTKMSTCKHSKTDIEVKVDKKIMNLSKELDIVQKETTHIAQSRAILRKTRLNCLRRNTSKGIKETENKIVLTAISPFRTKQGTNGFLPTICAPIRTTQRKKIERAKLTILNLM